MRLVKKRLKRARPILVNWELKNTGGYAVGGL